MKALLLASLALFIVACQKDGTHVATVSFQSQCGGCRVTYGVDDAVLGADSIGGAVYKREAKVEVGRTVFITATPTVISPRATMIWATVDGYQQGFRLLLPNDGAALSRSVELRFTVPELDQYGQP